MSTSSGDRRLISSTDKSRFVRWAPSEYLMNVSYNNNNRLSTHSFFELL